MTVKITLKKQRLGCGNCRYYIESLADKKQYDHSVSGICRRYPPTPVAYSDDEDHIETVIWPMVNSGEFCGEHELND